MKPPSGAEGQRGAFAGAVPPRGRGAVPLKGNAPYAAPSAPCEGQTRILLSEAASKHLKATGETCFRIVAADMSNEHPGRFVIHLAPCPLDIARQAEGVILGTYAARRVKAREGPSKSHSGGMHALSSAETGPPPFEDSL
jgi:hypothetical protein